MSETKHYVAGFLFRSYDDVALVRKNRPEWQRGRLNGIGGKVEEREGTDEAMVREFREETGAEVACWKPFCRLHVKEGNTVIHFYAAMAPEGVHLTSTTDEEVGWYDAEEVTRCFNILPNLRWLIPLARESLSNPKEAVVISDRP